MFSNNSRDNRQMFENNSNVNETSNYNEQRREERELIGLIGVTSVWEKSPPQPINE